MKTTTITLLLTLLSAGLTPALAADPEQIEAAPRRIAMFKNGVALVHLTADLTEAQTTYHLTPLPAATFGSLWLGWPENWQVDRIRTQQAWIRQRVPQEEVLNHLRGQFGADAAIDAQDLVIHRRVLGPVLALDVAPPEAPPEVPPAPGNLPRATDTTRAAVPGQLAITYLAQGIAWSPSVVVHLDDANADLARLIAKAVVVNDLMDLAGTDLELIAGYPNLQFAGTPTALKLDPLPQLLAQLRNQGRQDRDVLSNTMLQQRVAYGRSAAGAAMPSMPATPVAGEGSEDLYFYRLDDTTLAKGERGYFPLFAATVPIEHLHTWDIPDFIDDNNQYQHDPARQRPEIVWHALKLTNTTDRPWTTSPAMTMKNGRVLGQDTLHYTPPAGSTRLKITQAVAVDAQQNEYEVERQHNTIKIRGYQHDRVTVAGELTLTNYKPEAIEVIVTKAFSGELLEATEGHETLKLARGLQRTNPRSKIEWCVTVPPGKDNPTTLTYRYQVYVR